MLLKILHWIILFPIQLLLLCATLLTDFFALFTRPVNRSFPQTDITNKQCSIIILNWNGLDLLQECLPYLIRAVKKDGGDHEILVVDNGSSDKSMDWINQNFPELVTINLEKNLGFGEGNNRGVAAASKEIVVLLNNDMIVNPNFLKPLLEPFTEPDVFAVSSQIFHPPNRKREETGNTSGGLKKGYLHLGHELIQDYHSTRRFLPVLWAGGGSSAFRRDYFLKLGGFSSIFSPCYVEDTDLSYRAWRRGLRVLFSSESRVIHKHRSTTSRIFKSRTIREMIEQRKLLYLWKNYELKNLISHFFLFPFLISQTMSLKSYLKTLFKIPKVFFLRFREPFRTYKEKQFLEWIQRPLTYLNYFSPLRRSPIKIRYPKILIVSAYLPHLGKHGGAGRVFQLIKQLSDQYRFTLVSFIENKNELKEVDQVRPYCEHIETVFRKEYEPVSPYPYEPFEEFNCANFRHVLEAVLTEKDFDLVHFEWTQMSQYGDLVPHFPKVVTEIEVNWAAHQSLISLERNPLRRIRRYYNTLQTLNRELQLCRKMDSVICVTKSDSYFLEGFLPKKRIQVLNTGVDTKYFTPSPSHRVRPNTLVYVGAFRHQPNVDAMLYFHELILPQIQKYRPNVHLYIVGSSPPNEIKSLANSPNITVTGFVEDIRNYYAQAQVVIVPLRTGVGIRGKILEGWAAGKAMVATSIACLGIRATHGENILIADEPKKFARYTTTLLDSPDYCLQLGLAGRKTATNYYEWENLSVKLRELYKSTNKNFYQSRNRGEK